MTIFQLAYLSAAAPGIGENDVHAILRKSTANNRRDGLSGMLLLVDQTFFQVLEGPKETVERTFGRISRDPRHSAIMRVIEQEKPERSFPRWSMGFEKIAYGDPAGEELPFDVRELANEPSLPEVRRKSPEILSFMRSLYASRDMRGAPDLDRTS